MRASAIGETPDEWDLILVQLRELMPNAFPDCELGCDALLSALEFVEPDSSPIEFIGPGFEGARQQTRAATSAPPVPHDRASISQQAAHDVPVCAGGLQVLKLLKNGRSRSVKLFYIVPRYSTGGSLTCNDDFCVPERQCLAGIGQDYNHGNTYPSSSVVSAPVNGTSLYKHLGYDSHFERNYATQIEAFPVHVELFRKLPHRFRSRMSVGGYSPDCAIVCDANAVAWLYLVRETKEPRDLDRPGWDDAIHSRFARHHFDAVPIGPVDYEYTTEGDGLLLYGNRGSAA